MRLNNDLAAALLADAGFSGARRLSAWAQNIDTDGYPVLAVGLPGAGIRRKTKGWVQRDERKFVTVTDKAKEDLYSLTESAMRYLQEMAEAFAGSAERGGAQ